MPSTTRASTTHTAHLQSSSQIKTITKTYNTQSWVIVYPSIKDKYSALLWRISSTPAKLRGRKGRMSKCLVPSCSCFTTYANYLGLEDRKELGKKRSPHQPFAPRQFSSSNRQAYLVPMSLLCTYAATQTVHFTCIKTIHMASRYILLMD